MGSHMIRFLAAYFLLVGAIRMIYMLHLRHKQS